MNFNDEIFNKIQNSIQAARDAVKLKEKIENDIFEVLSMVSKITDDAIGFDLLINDNENPFFLGCEKIIFINKKSNPYNKFILCGYSIDEMTGYPVKLESEVNVFTCNDDETLKLTLADFITSKENSIKIVKLISLEDDIPF
ncbi:hypothetical protein [Pectobacterium polaris]|uniref:hypothetical protein n=1 Tax=Pectobacterium polaris TaxID=2042057 RepID=UPI0015836490|nr:hypothetical protein [Pectobacterium polaris]